MKSRNLFWGLFFILAAIAIIVNQIGIMPGISLINLIITIFLIPIIITSIKHVNFYGILFPIAIMGILYSDLLGIQSLTPWPILGIALFLSIGLSIMIRPKSYPFEKDYTTCSSYVEETTEVGNDEELNIYTRFNGSIKYIKSENLKRVNLFCSFGGSKVYFDNAKMADDEMILNLDVNFSGVDLFIPKEWKLINNVNCAFGGIEEKNSNNQAGDKKIILTGKTNFSGIQIIYV